MMDVGALRGVMNMPVEYCITAECPARTKGRKLCKKCLNLLAYRILTKKELTWEQAEQQGLCGPAMTRQQQNERMGAVYARKHGD